MENKITKKAIALKVIQNEFNANRVLARKKAIYLIMKKLGQKEVNGSVVSLVDGTIKKLKNANFIKTLKRGLYTKI